MSNQSIQLKHLKYRPDIDGLRAIAVVAVVAFHAFPDLIKGGFIGVDIFFVISGFLITTIIYENLDNNNFNFGIFYSRRIKRIFPSLILVLIFCYSVGWFALLSDEFKQLGKHIAAGASFISNFVLWNEAGYFDNTADTKPLLHLWSLAIEEQFYIIWPLIIWLSYKNKFNLLVATFIVGSISLILNIAEIQHNPVATFFSPQTRFWELLVGSSLAYFALYGHQIKNQNILRQIIFWTSKLNKKILSDAISIAGLMLLAYGFIRINKEVHFPGVWALIPTLGSLLIIAAGPSAMVNRNFLSNKVMVWIGLISFPLYLWHWPLLTFARIIKSEEPSASIRLILVALSFLLAWFTYKFIESRFRLNNDQNFLKVSILILLMGIVGYLGFNSYERGGLPFRMKDREAFEAYFENSPPDFKFFNKHDIFTSWHIYDCNYSDFEAYRNGSPTWKPLPSINSNCYTRDINKANHVFVWGDSHAQHLLFGLNKNLPDSWKVLQVATSACAPRISQKDSDTNYCDKANFVAVEKIKTSKAEVVIIAQNRDHSVSSALEINKKLKSLGVSRVIFIGPVPHWTAALPKLISRQLWINTPERTFIGVEKNQLTNNQKIKLEFLSNNLEYIDVTSLFCNQDGCLTRLGNDRLAGITTFDRDHLTPLSSDFVSQKLLIKAIVGH